MCYFCCILFGARVASPVGLRLFMRVACGVIDVAIELCKFAECVRCHTQNLVHYSAAPAKDNTIELENE